MSSGFCKRILTPVWLTVIVFPVAQACDCLRPKLYRLNVTHHVRTLCSALLTVHCFIQSVYTLRQLLASCLLRFTQQGYNLPVIISLRVPVEQWAIAGLTGFHDAPPLLYCAGVARATEASRPPLLFSRFSTMSKYSTQIYQAF